MKDQRSTETGQHRPGQKAERRLLKPKNLATIPLKQEIRSVWIF